MTNRKAILLGLLFGWVAGGCICYVIYRSAVRKPVSTATFSIQPRAQPQPPTVLDLASPVQSYTRSGAFEFVLSCSLRESVKKGDVVTVGIVIPDVSRLEVSDTLGSRFQQVLINHDEGLSPTVLWSAKAADTGADTFTVVLPKDSITCAEFGPMKESQP